MIQGHMHLHSPFAWVTCCMKWKKLNKETSIILQLEVYLILTSTNGFFNVQFENISIFIPRLLESLRGRGLQMTKLLINKSIKPHWYWVVGFCSWNHGRCCKSWNCKLKKETSRKWWKKGKKDYRLSKGWKKIAVQLSGESRFSRHATFHYHLLDFHWIRQVIFQLNE